MWEKTLEIIFGAVIGYSLSFTQQRISKKNQRLNEFYSPMIGLLNSIRSMGVVRLEVSRVSNEVWREHVAVQPFPYVNSEKEAESFDRVIDYENEQFKKEILPRYDKMLDIIEAKSCLAYPSTKKGFLEFTKFVNVWHRHLEGGLAPKTIQKLAIEEDSLKPFYEDLERHFQKLSKGLT